MPKTPKIPERLWFKHLGYESDAVGRFPIVCSVLIAVFRMLLIAALVWIGKAAVGLF